MKYWINVVSRDHVQRGVKGGFTQANHGKPHMLRRMHQGDWIVFYSPKTAYEGGEPLQAFSAIGEIADEEVYQEEMTADFTPWRRKVNFLKCQELPIKAVLDDLTFIRDRSHWGYQFRFGVFEINQQDFELIRGVMQAD
jgi:predicted RNA-binding protein